MLTPFVRAKLAHNDSLFGIPPRKVCEIPAVAPSTGSLVTFEGLNVHPRSGDPAWTAVCWSGGLESTMLTAGALGGSSSLVRITGLRECAAQLGLPRLEPVIVYSCAMAGASAVVLGLEYSPQSECKGDNRYFSSRYLTGLGDALGVAVLQPFIGLDKFSLYQRAHRLGVWFNSCIHFNGDHHAGEDGWCGDCFKCFQLGTFYRLSLHTGIAPSTFTGGMRNLTPNGRMWMEEVCDYLDGSGIDPVLDNVNIREAMVMAGLKPTADALRELWSD